MDVEYDSELSDTDYEEIDDSDTIRPYMYEPIRRERDEGFLMTLSVFSSPEHIVLRVSYCDRLLSIRLSVFLSVREQLLKNSSPPKPPNRFQ